MITPARIDEVSAWVGIHYYACRYYADQLQDRFPVHTVTWSQGNAFLVDGMAQRFSAANVRLNALILSIRQQGGEVLVTFMDTQTRQFTTLRGQNSNLCRTEAYRQPYHTESP